MNLLIQSLRRAFEAIFDYRFKKIRAEKDHYILYKIVDFYMEKNRECYKLQCSYTKAIFHVTIHDIVFDIDILHGLHPVQGCFIGIEYAKILKSTANTLIYKEKQKNRTKNLSNCRYGNHHLLYQDRKGLVGFECKDNGKQFLMDPMDIALSRDLIEEFDVAQAFYIGVWAGLKFVNPITNVQEHNKKAKTGHLRLVKG